MQNVINRDPYCEVRLANIEHAGKKTDKWMVELENEDGEMVPLSGVSGVHSEDYTLVPNLQVKDMVGDILTRTGHEFKPVPSFSESRSKHEYWDGKKRFSAKWCCEELAEDLPGNQAVALGVEAINSYDGSQAVGIRFFCMNMMCANQFYASNLLGNFVFRHVSRDAGINFSDNSSEALATLQRQAERFVKIVPALKQLKEHNLHGMRDYLAYRYTLNRECWKRSRDPEVLDELHHTGITSRLGLQQTANVDNLWGVLNAYNAVCTHSIGGFNGSALSDRVTTYTMDQARVLPQVA